MREMGISQLLQAPPNVLLYKFAPLGLSKRYLRLLGKFYYIANAKERVQIEKNITSVFKHRNISSEIIKKVFDGIFYHYSEKLIMAYRNLSKLKEEVREVLEYSGLEHLDNALKKGSVLLITGHFGAVEFMPLALHLRNYPVTMTVTFKTKQLKESLMRRATEGDVELIDCNEDDVMQKSLDAMRRGRILLTECDEVEAWKPHKNRTITAFGREIKYDRCLEVLCRRTGAKPLCSFMVRTQKGYCLNIVPVDYDNSIEEKSLAVQIFKTLEKFVLMFPDQWYQWKKFHLMLPEVA